MGQRANILPASWPAVNSSVLGYALYLVINATSLWGGVFPFFPADFHTVQTTFTFEITQSISFLAVFLATMVLSYRRPLFIRHALILAGAIPLSAGAFCLIAALYLPVFKMAFVVLGGILLGTGGAGFAFAWQRYFAAQEPDSGNFFLLAGTLIAPFIFSTLYVVPIAVRVYLVPLIMVPLCGLCALLCTRTIDYSQSQFEDVPREHPRVYLHVMQDNWRSALAIGALGFVSGIVRAIALENVSMGDLTNIASMLGSGVAAAIMLAVWTRKTFALDSERVFLVMFPVSAACLLAFPFVPGEFMFLMAGFVYMMFAFALMVMLLQCAQTSRDRGVSQGFVFGFFGSIVYTLQNLGFILSYASHMALPLSIDDNFATALFGTFTLAIALYLMRGGIRMPERTSLASKPDDVEFIVARPAAEAEENPVGDTEEKRVFRQTIADEVERAAQSSSANAERGCEAGSLLIDLTPTGAQRKDGATAAASSTGDAAQPAVDQIARACHELQKNYRLTNREEEIMEAIVRGNSVARIAEMFFISENTVRTHSKHIYRKLDVHRKQDIIDMIDELD